MIQLVVGAGIAYLGVIVVLMALENWMLFRPTLASEDWVEPALHHLTVEDVELQTADGTRIHGWWCPIHPPLPQGGGRGGRDEATGALLYCHGNAGNLSHRTLGLVAWLKHLRLPVFIFDYPGYGKSDGKPTEKGCYAAADAAYDWLTQSKKILPERILVYGSSLGGGVAVDLVSRKAHRALILSKAVTSANSPKRFFILEGSEHNDPLTEEFFQSLQEFLNDK